MAKFINANARDLDSLIFKMEFGFIPSLNRINNSDDFFHCLKEMEGVEVISDELMFSQKGFPLNNSLPIYEDCLNENIYAYRYKWSEDFCFGDPKEIEDLEIFYIRTLHGPIIVFNLISYEIINEFYNSVTSLINLLAEKISDQTFKVISSDRENYGYTLFASYSNVGKHYLILSNFAELLDHPLNKHLTLMRI
jgi:hypothetical protein